MGLSILVGFYIFPGIFKLIGSTGIYIWAGRPLLSVLFPGNKEQFGVSGPEIRLEDD